MHGAAAVHAAARGGHSSSSSSSRSHGDADSNNDSSSSSNTAQARQEGAQDRCQDGRGFHHGLDLAMRCGTPLYAGIRLHVVSNDTLGPAYGDNPVLLTSSAVRPYVRSLVERFRPQTIVMSQNEIHPKARLRSAGAV